MNKPEADSAELNRRDFLKGGSLATVMTLLGGVELFAQPAPDQPAETKPVGPKIKVGLIGLGPWGREILEELGRLPQAEIAAICDHYPPMLRRSAIKAPGAAQVEDYQAVLDNKDIQAVVVATPTHLHKDIAIAALQAGKHVYCEAPLAHTVEDAKAIALAAKSAVGKVFQAGLQMRSDPQRHFLLPFIRSGALGRFVMVRAQWHKKQSWRLASPNPEREKAANWRLSRETSPGLVGELGIYQFDQAGWFLNSRPVSISGFGAILRGDNDGRDVPDTVQLIAEYEGGVRLIYDATLANSFDSDYEIYYGTDAAVMLRDGKAWMFKEVDSPLLGWEVYARKDAFYKETGIALVAGGSKQTAVGDKPAEQTAPFPPLHYALQSFLGNCPETDAAVEDFAAAYGAADKTALAQHLASIEFRPAATYSDGYAATVLALKANEAVVKGERLALQPEWFELT